MLSSAWDHSWRITWIINTEGEQEELNCFSTHGLNTEAHTSCLINWQNQWHVFGGRNQMRQISRLNGRRLDRIGDLAFDHYFGSCSMVNNQIHLCFHFADNNDNNDYQRCRRSTGPLETFSEIALSNYEHGRSKAGSTDSKSACLTTVKCHYNVPQ